MTFYYNHRGIPNVYYVVSENEKYSEYLTGIIQGEYFIPDVRRRLPKPFDRIKIVNNQFTYSYEKLNDKAIVNIKDMTIKYGLKTYHIIPK